VSRLFQNKIPRAAIPVRGFYHQTSGTGAVVTIYDRDGTSMTLGIGDRLYLTYVWARVAASGVASLVFNADGDDDVDAGDEVFVATLANNEQVTLDFSDDPLEGKAMTVADKPFFAHASGAGDLVFTGYILKA